MTLVEKSPTNARFRLPALVEKGRFVTSTPWDYPGVERVRADQLRPGDILHATDGRSSVLAYARLEGNTVTLRGRWRWHWELDDETGDRYQTLPREWVTPAHTMFVRETR